MRGASLRVKVALLTGGKDPHYVRGLVRELARRGVRLIVIGNDELVDLADARNAHVDFRNLVGGARPDEGLLAKAWRVSTYYVRLLVFALRTDVRLFHILWFRKFPLAERLLVTAYLKLLGKTVAYTAHNVDDRARDGRRGTFPNRLSLIFLYKAVDTIFVHTEQMKHELVEEFGVSHNKVTVVPFGINDVIPVAPVSRMEARQRLGLGLDKRVLLFFGNIAPYKGVEDLLRALARLVREDGRFTLVLAGRVKDKTCEAYWDQLEGLIEQLQLREHVRKEIRYIPDQDVGLLFRASDVSVLPYRRVDQSGVLALSYAQGLPVIAADVGSMREDILEGETGLLYRPGDSVDLAAKIRTHFESESAGDPATRRRRISEYGVERFSWTTNAERTHAVYERLLEDSVVPAHVQ
jgi:glycosyltransferase involved in cell wall biosynthesis